MSVVSSLFVWTRQPDQMDKLPPEEKKFFLITLIQGIKDEKIRFEKSYMIIKTPYGGSIFTEIGDSLFIVRKKNYPSYIMSAPPYFLDGIIRDYEKEEGNESRTYSISCV